VAGLIAATLACIGPAPAQEIKLTLADQNSPTAWGPSHALQPCSGVIGGGYRGAPIDRRDRRGWAYPYSNPCIA
jgi:hypothetical protein